MTPLSRTEITARICELSALTLKRLREEWLSVFKAPPPHAARQDYLARGLAYQMQVKAYGGLSPALSRRVKRLCENYIEDPAHVPAAKLSIKLGTRILREWQGRMHEAIVVEGGFLYEGETYRSLSVIARKITGTRWSGPAFFGLKNPRKRLPSLQASEANALAAEAHHGV